MPKLISTLMLAVPLTVSAANDADPTRAPANRKVVLEARSTGFQVYECDANPGESTGYHWQFKGLESEAKDRKARSIAIEPPHDGAVSTLLPPCGSENMAGRARLPYSATYLFYAPE